MDSWYCRWRRIMAGRIRGGAHVVLFLYINLCVEKWSIWPLVCFSVRLWLDILTSNSRQYMRWFMRSAREDQSVSSQETKWFNNVKEIKSSWQNECQSVDPQFPLDFKETSCMKREIKQWQKPVFLFLGFPTLKTIYIYLYIQHVACTWSSPQCFPSPSCAAW